jgi:hypothetical protein
MAHRTDSKTVGGVEWHLQTVDAITGAKVLVRLTRNCRGLAAVVASAKDGGADAMVGALGKALADVDPDAVIEDALLLLAPLKMGEPGKRIGVSREQLGALLAGNVEHLLELAWWAVAHNYPFVGAALAAVQGSLAGARLQSSGAPTT